MVKVDTHGSKGKGYIAVDLDGTLAKYTGWKGYDHIGEPVPAMLARVKQWVSEGKDVRIMTARAAPSGDSAGPSAASRAEPIKAWLKKHVGKELKITHKKDTEMVELWDDRAIQVKPNTGQRVDGVKKAMEASMSGIKELNQFAKGEKAMDPAEEEAKKEEEKEPKEMPLNKGGPYIGPKGGKWADPQHTIPWKESGEKKEMSGGKQAQIKADAIAVALGKKFKGTSVTGLAVRDGAEIWITVRDKKVSPLRFEGEAKKITGANWRIDTQQAFPGSMLFRTDDYIKEVKKSLTGISDLESFSKGGPYIGPRGGKWADAKHTIPWKEGGDKRGKDKVVSEMPGTDPYKGMFGQKFEVGDTLDIHGHKFIVGSIKETTDTPGNREYEVTLKQEGGPDLVGRLDDGGRWEPSDTSGEWKKWSHLYTHPEHKGQARILKHKTEAKVAPAVATLAKKSTKWLRGRQDEINDSLTKLHLEIGAAEGGFKNPPKDLDAKYQALRKEDHQIIAALDAKHFGKSEVEMSGINDLESFAKGEGEGSRGGHIIGHTASGKPIYGSKDVKSGEHHKNRLDHHRTKARAAVASGDHDKAEEHMTRYTHHLVQHRKATVDKDVSTGTIKHGVHGEMSITLMNRGKTEKEKEFYRKQEAHHDKLAKEHDPRNSEQKAKKSMEDKEMSAINELDEFAKGGAGGLPTGKPKMGGVGGEQGGPLAGKTSGSSDSSSGPPIDAPKTKKQKFSEDDKEDEKQMKPHKKPIEGTAKSLGGDTTPQGQREMVAREHAAKVSQLQKGEDDVEVGVGVAPPAKQPEELEKSKEWNQGDDSHVTYSTRADQEVEKLFKSEDDFYTNGSPTIGLKPLLTQQTVCSGCKEVMSKSLSACPTCGLGATEHKVMPGVVIGGSELNKSSDRKAPLLQRKSEQDLVLPDGFKPSDR